MPAETGTKPKTAATPRLKAAYAQKYAEDLMKELDLKNINQVPRLEKIILNSGLGRAKDDKKVLEVASNTLKHAADDVVTRRDSVHDDLVEGIV